MAEEGAVGRGDEGSEEVGVRVEKDLDNRRVFCGINEGRIRTCRRSKAERKQTNLISRRTTNAGR